MSWYGFVSLLHCGNVVLLLGKAYVGGVRKSSSGENVTNIPCPSHFHGIFTAKYVYPGSSTALLDDLFKVHVDIFENTFKDVLYKQTY